ncbi:MAG: ATP-binding cassette domain-containing protein [Clostridia bacterium]|nr:ATP-binding cassette domain-containing protein [Clostridia bacterium]
MQAIEIADIHKRYYLSHALRGVNLGIEQGKIVGLLGPNGAGKSTLLRIIAGIGHPTSGGVRVMGRRVSIRAIVLVVIIALAVSASIARPWVSGNRLLEQRFPGQSHVVTRSSNQAS